MVGETPSDFTKRLRLEKAVQLIRFGKRQPLSDVAHQCGFTSSSDFTRSFKQRFGVAPSKWDRNTEQHEDATQVDSTTPQTPLQLQRPPSRANPDGFRVRIRELPTRHVAYIRVANPYQGNGVLQACHRLLQWAEARQIAHRPWLGYQFENPTITELDACYYCVGLELENRLQPQGEIGMYRFPPMLVAEVEMKGDIDQEIRLLQWLYGSWLPRSQYVPDDQPCFEAWIGKPFAHGHSHFELRIQLPIRS